MFRLFRLKKKISSHYNNENVSQNCFLKGNNKNETIDRLITIVIKSSMNRSRQPQPVSSTFSKFPPLLVLTGIADNLPFTFNHSRFDISKCFRPTKWISFMS